jgi:hypothetical protein
MSNATVAQVSLRIPRLLLSLVTFCSFLAVTGHRAFALSCGDNVTTDTTLTADLGPCPGNGLGVDEITAHVTIKLNGHQIIGSGMGSGIVVGGVAAFGLTIKGPGKIVNFQTGITMGGGAANVIVDKLELSGEQSAIDMNGSPGPVEIRKNFIVGGSQGQNGISFGDAAGIYIHHNTISKFSGPAVLILGETSSIIDDNIISLNQIGIESADPSFSGCNEIRRNLVTLNTGDGIDFGTTDPVSPNVATPPTPKCVIEKNIVTWNGGSGISVTGGDYGVEVERNFVFFNAVDGIAVFDADPGNIKVSGNQAFGNATDDLFWNSVGTNACWKNNTFGTSNPATLPACP